MRVLITGSRDWPRHGEYRITMILDMILALCDLLGTKLTVVHGACPSGVDAIVDRWARRREDAGVIVEAHPANWGQYKRSAGPVRNQAMVDRGADLCIGFVYGASIGTRHTQSLARNAKITTFTVPWEEPE